MNRFTGAVLVALMVAVTTTTAHMVENHLYEHPQSPAAMECVTFTPADQRDDGTYRSWRFTNRCNRIITVVTCIERGPSGDTDPSRWHPYCNFLVEEYGREAVGEFQYYTQVDVVKPGATAWVSLGRNPPSAVRYAACFGNVLTEGNYMLGIIRDGLIASLPNGDFACMLHGVEATTPPPVQGRARG